MYLNYVLHLVKVAHTKLYLLFFSNHSEYHAHKFPRSLRPIGQRRWLLIIILLKPILLTRRALERAIRFTRGPIIAITLS